MDIKMIVLNLERGKWTWEDAHKEFKREYDAWRDDDLPKLKRKVKEEIHKQIVDILIMCEVSERRKRIINNALGKSL